MIDNTKSLEMLKMYLQDYDIDCDADGESYQLYNKLRGNYGKWVKGKLRISLKYSTNGDPIYVSMSRACIYIEGTEIYGGTPDRHDPSWRRIDKELIANLNDPQSFERIRLWIRYQEKRARTTLNFKNVKTPTGTNVLVQGHSHDLKVVEDIVGLSIEDIAGIIEPTRDPYIIP